MRVLVIHNAYKFFGGEDTVFNQEVKAYKKLGYEVEVYQKSNIFFISFIVNRKTRNIFNKGVRPSNAVATSSWGDSDNGMFLHQSLI